ncbi:ribokinase [Epidermidibacterium keratini]|uniref:ribokinase n=1 Tax=Epidermidibacterium keratini TaxID=1891644 RepID=UPI001CEF8BD3|nr:ribokinase [Epidermidibacterium keratini]
MSVVILGSANVDVIIELDRIPGPGETVLTDASDRGRGGKGNNQAIAAARAGAPTVFLGAVGADESGDFLLEAQREAGIDVTHVRRIEDAPSGTAYVMVDSRAENAIVVVAGANGQLLSLTDAEREVLRGADALLMQLEVPMATVLEAAAQTKRAGGYVVLNAAPYAELPDELIANLDLLMVNEHEAALAAGRSGTPEELAATIGERVPDVLITLGAAGSLLQRRGSDPVRINAPKVDAVDTTGAGDTFAGAYVAATVAGLPEQGRLEYAAAAAALAVQRPGAVASIPRADEIQDAVRRYFA